MQRSRPKSRGPPLPQLPNLIKGVGVQRLRASHHCRHGLHMQENSSVRNRTSRAATACGSLLRGPGTAARDATWTGVPCRRGTVQRRTAPPMPVPHLYRGANDVVVRLLRCQAISAGLQGKAGRRSVWAGRAQESCAGGEAGSGCCCCCCCCWGMGGGTLEAGNSQQYGAAEAAALTWQCVRSTSDFSSEGPNFSLTRRAHSRRAARSLATCASGMPRRARWVVG